MLGENESECERARELEGEGERGLVCERRRRLQLAIEKRMFADDCSVRDLPRFSFSLSRLKS